MTLCQKALKVMGIQGKCFTPLLTLKAMEWLAKRIDGVCFEHTKDLGWVVAYQKNTWIELHHSPLLHNALAKAIIDYDSAHDEV